MPKYLKANQIDICYEVVGDPTNPPLVLIRGLGSQMIAWGDSFCQQLADQGFWIISFDNRDVGLSTKFDAADVPDMASLMAGDQVDVPYLISDMAPDVVALMDGLGVAEAHIVGMSMGGMIAQMLAIEYPTRVSTLTSIMSAAGPVDRTTMDADVMDALTGPTPTERSAYIEHSVQAERLYYGTGYPFDEARVRQQYTDSYDRCFCPDGVTRQMAAVLASGSRVEALRKCTIPTLVIHGSEDPLVPVEAGIETAEIMPNSELLIIEGMGHFIVTEVWEDVVAAITKHGRKASM